LNTSKCFVKIGIKDGEYIRSNVKFLVDPVTIGQVNPHIYTKQ